MAARRSAIAEGASSNLVGSTPQPRWGTIAGTVKQRYPSCHQALESPRSRATMKHRRAIPYTTGETFSCGGARFRPRSFRFRSVLDVAHLLRAVVLPRRGRQLVQRL